MCQVQVSIDVRPCLYTNAHLARMKRRGDLHNKHRNPLQSFVRIGSSVDLHEPVALIDDQDCGQRKYRANRRGPSGSAFTLLPSKTAIKYNWFDPVLSKTAIL